MEEEVVDPSQHRHRLRGTMGTLGRVVFSLGKAARSTGQALDRLGSRLQGGNTFKDEGKRFACLAHRNGFENLGCGCDIDRWKVVVVVASMPALSLF